MNLNNLNIQIAGDTFSVDWANLLFRNRNPIRTSPNMLNMLRLHTITHTKYGGPKVPLTTVNKKTQQQN